jgi:Uma2 family endonuclease
MASIDSSTGHTTLPSFIPGFGEPTWEVALLYPVQGQWSEFEYLDVTEGTNRLVEFTDGKVEVLEMPTSAHQRILAFLYENLKAFVLAAGLGEVLFATLRVRIRENKFREPDIIFMKEEHRDRVGDEYWQGADLVMEVVSNDPESRKRDLVQKPIDYAEGGIPEYWIVDPQEKKITVLALEGTAYQQHGVFGEGETATSKLLPGFSVAVTDVFAAAKV